ncbi:MAG: HlyD family efflux transporter periplasmic adaptor subunit [Cyanobacteriota bacterium]
MKNDERQLTTEHARPTQTGSTHTRHPHPVTDEPQSTPKPQTEKSSPPPSSKRKRSWKPAVYALGGVGFVALVGWAFWPSPVPVDMAVLERGLLQVTVEAEGKTRLRERFEIAAPVDGRLERIAVRVGDPVAAGDVIARMDPLPLASQVQAIQAQIQRLEAEKRGVDTQRPKAASLVQAEANITAAQARHQQALAQQQEAQASFEQAQRERQRVEGLFSQGVISRQALEEAELMETSRRQTLFARQQEVEQAQAAIVAAQQGLQVLQAEQRDPDYLLQVYDAQIRSLEADLASLSDSAQRTTITSPGAGQVLRVHQESARFVPAGTVLVEVGDPGQLELEIDVLSSDAVRIQPGDPVQVRQWGGVEVLRGSVRTVEPAAFTKVSALGVEEQRVNIIADLEDPPARLGDGYRIEAEVIIWQNEAALKLPLSALFRCQEEWCVYVAEAERAQQRQIALGQRSTTLAEVVSGLEPGETVILYPSDQVQPGRRIQPR